MYFLACFQWRRKKHRHNVVTAALQLRARHRFVLNEGDRCGSQHYFADTQIPRKLKNESTQTILIAVHLESALYFHFMRRQNARRQLIFRNHEGFAWLAGSARFAAPRSHDQRHPDVIEQFSLAGIAGLGHGDVLRQGAIEEEVEGAQPRASEAGVQKPGRLAAGRSIGKSREQAEGIDLSQGFGDCAPALDE